MSGLALVPWTFAQLMEKMALRNYPVCNNPECNIPESCKYRKYTQIPNVHNNPEMPFY